MTKKKGEVSTFKAKEKKKVTGVTGIIAAALIILVIAYFAMSGIKIIILNLKFASLLLQCIWILGYFCFLLC